METADTLSDLSNHDAGIHFTNGAQTGVNFSGENWTEFGELHHPTGNTGETSSVKEDFLEEFFAESSSIRPSRQGPKLGPDAFRSGLFGFMPQRVERASRSMTREQLPLAG